MRKSLMVLLMAAVILLAGCDTRVFLELDFPIIIEPKPSPRYQNYVEGYISYDFRNHHITITGKPNYRRYYEPLENAKVTVLETGKTVRTDERGYFYIPRVPYGWVNLKVVHSWIGPWDGSYFEARSK